MNNIEALRSLLRDLPCEQEANEFLDAIKDEFEDADGRIKELEKELKDLEEGEEDRDQTSESVDLGLDTLHYRLDKGNIHVAAQLQSWCSAVRKQNALPELMPGVIN